MAARSGELSKVWFRSDRFIHTDQGWYFVTRECNQQGPFFSHKEAENELNLYIRQQNDNFYLRSH